MSQNNELAAVDLSERLLISYDEQFGFLYRCMTAFSVVVGTMFTFIFFLHLFALSWSASFKSVLGFLP